MYQHFYELGAPLICIAAAGEIFQMFLVGKSNWNCSVLGEAVPSRIPSGNYSLARIYT